MPAGETTALQAACAPGRPRSQRCHGGRRQPTETLKRGGDGSRALPLFPAAIREAAFGQSGNPAARRSIGPVKQLGCDEALQLRQPRCQDHRKWAQRLGRRIATGPDDLCRIRPGLDRPSSARGELVGGASRTWRTGTTHQPAQGQSQRVPVRTLPPPTLFTNISVG